MILYPSKPLTYFRILLKSLRHHPIVLKQTILLIAVMVIVKDLFIYLGGLPSNIYLRWLFMVLISVVLIYLWSVMLYLTSELFSARVISLQSAIQRVNKRLLQIYGCCLTYVIGAALLVAFANFLLLIAKRYDADIPLVMESLWVVVLGGIPTLVYLISCLFALPIVIMEDVGVFAAFNQSRRLVKRRWFGVFGVYMIFLITMLLTSPNTIHAHLLRHYHIEVLFDFVVLCVMLPIFTNAVLFMLNDLRLKFVV